MADRIGDTMIHPWICLRWAIGSPLKATVAMGIGLLLGIALASFAWVYAVAVSPVSPRLVGPLEVWRGAAGTIWIRGHYESAPPLRCLRQDAQLLIEINSPRPTYYTVGSGLGGRGLTGSRYSYDILKSLPADFPPGDWEFLVRLHYECEPFGLIHWEKTLEPVIVHIPE